MRAPENKRQEVERETFSNRKTTQTPAQVIEEAFFQDRNGKAIIDQDLNWLAFNPAIEKEFENFFGLKPVVGTNIRDMKAPNKEAFKKLTDDLDKALQGKVRSYRFIRQKPGPAAFKLYFEPLQLPNNRKAVSITAIRSGDNPGLPGAIHKFQDFADLADLIPHMVWITDARGQIHYINNYWTSYTGENSEKLLTQSYSMAVHDEDRPLVLEAWSAAVTNIQPYQAEFRIRNKQGQYRWFLSRASPIKDRQGNVLRWVGVSIDVHDYKNVEKTLLQQRGFLKALAENVPAFILSLDEQGNILFANQFHEKLGFKPAELIGQAFDSAYHLKDPAYALSLHEGIKKALKGNEETVTGRILDTKGQAIEVETIVYPYKQNMLQEKGVLLLSFDVTSHKKVQESLQNEKKELEAVNQDFDLLFHRMAHDIYGPLSSLEGLFQLLLEDPVITKKQAPLLKHIKTSLGKFRSTLGNITNWVAASARSDQERESTQVPTLMEGLLEDMEETITQTCATVTATYDSRIFEMSARNLRSILYNLISNSIKYRKKEVPPSIEIRFFENKTYKCCIEIQDNGIGIPARDLNKVVAAFEKLDPTSQGLGLGMFVVKRIVERYQGYIEIESIEEKGTKLRIFLCPR